MGNTLSFVFTEDSFRIDKPDVGAGKYEKQKRDFLTDRYRALFRLGFEPPEKDETPSLRFMHTLARSYIEELTNQPDLKVAREWISIELSDDNYDKLSRQVPFDIGSEYINRSWMALIYMKLTKVFSMDIREYNGTERTFLTEKSQNLRIPERIFFHLVENTKDIFASFAFIATYSTKDEDGHVRHSQPSAEELKEKVRQSLKRAGKREKTMILLYAGQSTELYAKAGGVRHGVVTSKDMLILQVALKEAGDM